MKQIEHVNILPFYGVSTMISDFFLVSPWYENGNVEQYLEKNPSINRYELASVMDMVIFRTIFFELLVFFTFTLPTLHFAY